MLRLDSIIINPLSQLVTFTDEDRDGFTATVTLCRAELELLLQKLTAALRREYPDAAHRYNHAFDIAFEVHTDHDARNVTAAELTAALQQRVNNLAGKAEMVQACGMPFDTCEL